MCLIAIAYKAHPQIRLLVLANRDEFHQRPTKACAWWGSDDSVLSGRDLEAGGTWLAINRQGRFAAVTNYREVPSQAGSRSRGLLPPEFLESTSPATAFCHAKASCFDDYGGFNLLAFDGHDLIWASNRGGRFQTLPSGVHAISNRQLNSDWPKVQSIRSSLEKISSGKVTTADCLDTLRDQHRAEDSLLPDTGVGLETERFLSPAFIISDRLRHSQLYSLDHQRKWRGAND